MIDCHCHLLPWFLDNEPKPETIFVNSTCQADWENCSRLDTKHFFPFFGIHPWFIGDSSNHDVDQLQNFLANLTDHAFGIGEIGLDRNTEAKDQEDILKRQLDIAANMRVPVSLHCVKAWGKLFSLLDKTNKISKVMLHGFNGPAEILDEAIHRGYFLSFSPKSLEYNQFIGNVPLERLFLETDAEAKNCPDRQAYLSRLKSAYLEAGEKLGFTQEKLLGIIQNNAAVFTASSDFGKNQS
jgi:TatD DNase family protein